MEIMISVKDSEQTLSMLGQRLRLARLARDEPMAVFAQRVGVSVPTLRAMERGAASVAISHWVHALWALDRLHDLAAVLAPQASVLDLARQAAQPARQRARRRPR
jgi:transcriptional regulator with XRE-family HTH domain